MGNARPSHLCKRNRGLTFLNGIEPATWRYSRDLEVVAAPEFVSIGLTRRQRRAHPWENSGASSIPTSYTRCIRLDTDQYRRARSYFPPRSKSSKTDETCGAETSCRPGMVKCWPERQVSRVRQLVGRRALVTTLIVRRVVRVCCERVCVECVIGNLPFRQPAPTHNLTR